jgi:signal transduction histidine kinase
MTAPRSLRGQLLLAFVGLASFVVLIGAIAMVALVRQAVWAPLDAQMEEEAETFRTLVGDRGPELADAVARIASEPDFGPGKFVRVIAPDGRVLAEAGRAPAAAERDAPAGPATLHDRHDVLRIARYPAPGGTSLEIGVRVHDRERTIRRATWAIALGAPLLLGVVVAVAATIARRASREIDRLALELETVEAGSLDRRLASRRTTEVDRLAAVLNRLLGRLERAVGHLRRFTGDAAHELRTPVAALRAHIEVALARPPSVEAYRDGLLDALEQTERLERLAADLLTLSAVEAGTGRSEAVRLDVVARDVAGSLEPIAQEQGRPFTCTTDGPVVVRGTRELLERLVLNLVDNAFRHTPPAAAVELSVRAVDGLATVAVRDHGAGIPDADVSALFERFHRGRTGAPGAGLGLALCHEIATSHRGRIALARAPGGGTIATVELPLDAPADGGSAARSA